MALGLTILPVNIEPPITNPAIVDSSALIAPRSAEAHYDPTLGIKAQIRAIGASSTPSMVEIALSIAESESGFENVEGVTGDMGIFQFSTSTWAWACKGDPYNIDENIKCAYKLLDDYQLRHWSASREDRGKYQGWFNRLSQETKDYINNLNVFCNCVAGIRSYGIDYYGSAKDFPIGSRPMIGGVAKFYYTKTWTYHVAKIVGFWEHGIIVDDTNYDQCEETKGRLIRTDSKSLLGFGNP